MLAHGERNGRNNKLEIFLRRKLKSEIYEDVRWYEPVVVRREGSLAYKHVVVTGEKIFLVDTPPKEITPLLCINNIIAVVMVHDLPEFLEGGLRDRTTHILLKVKNEETPRTHVEPLAKSPKTNTGYTRRASTTLRRGSLQIPIMEETHSKSLPEDASGSSSIENGDVKVNRLFGRRRSCKDILSLGCSLDLDKYNHVSKTDKTKSNITSKRNRPPLLRGLQISEYGEGGSEPQINRRSISCAGSPMEETVDGGLTPNFFVRGEFGSRPISPALFDIFNRVELKVSTPTDGCSITTLGRSVTPDPSTTHSTMPRSLSAFDTYELNSNELTALRSRSALDKPLFLQGRGSLERRSRSTSFIDSADERGTQYREEESEELHLYTLSTSTFLFHLLHSLWMSFLLAPSGSSSCRQMTPDGVGQTLKSLCNDLRDAEGINEVFSLLTDLLHGMVKYSNVRRVFWKDTEALSLVRDLLNKYSKPSDTSDDENYFEGRERELRVLTISLKIIEASLFRSQGCPFKSKVFQNKSLLKSLLKELFYVPDIAPPYHLMCRRFLTDYKELSEGNWQILPEREILFMVQRVIDASVGAIFQLLEAIFETGWSLDCAGNVKTKSNRRISPTSLSSMLQFVPVEEWLSFALPKFLLLVQSKWKDLEESSFELEQKVVLTYEYLAVLLALLKQSPKALAFCTSNYSEELRYYVSESELKRKFENLDHPLTLHTYRIAKAVSKLMIR